MELRPVVKVVAITAHSLWGIAHDFDLNRVYALAPALSLAAMRFLWACSLVGHVASTWFSRDDIVAAVQDLWPFMPLQ